MEIWLQFGYSFCTKTRTKDRSPQAQKRPTFQIGKARCPRATSVWRGGCAALSSLIR